jgi:hypothetical protein
MVPAQVRLVPQVALDAPVPRRVGTVDVLEVLRLNIGGGRGNAKRIDLPLSAVFGQVAKSATLRAFFECRRKHISRESSERRDPTILRWGSPHHLFTTVFQDSPKNGIVGIPTKLGKTVVGIPTYSKTVVGIPTNLKNSGGDSPNYLIIRSFVFPPHIPTFHPHRNTVGNTHSFFFR